MKVKSLFNMGMVVIMLVTSFAISQPVAAEAPVKFTPRIAAGADAVPGEVVVAFADSQDKSLVQKIEQAVDTAKDAGGEVTRLSLDGSAVVQVDGDTSAALAELNANPAVAYAEPNYVFSVPTDGTNVSAPSDYVYQDVVSSPVTNWKETMAVPRSSIQSMVAMGVYPSDPYSVDYQQGWISMGGNIVWPNTTPSANICEVDTGVDYTHPDLSYTASYSYSVKVKRKWQTVTVYYTVYRVLQGYDFVNADSNVMDDNGHGTHVAGIMVAMQNNGAGISGVSTGNVVAVKALDAQGIGTNFDITKAIQYCADRTDVRVINLSLGGPSGSTALKNALIYATTPTTELVPWSPALPGCATAGTCIYGKGKLVVVAAGNTTNPTLDPYTKETYPAAYAIDSAFPNNRILSVASTGKSFNGDYNYACNSSTSKRGGWVTVAAPGENIYSTTPYDKPFYKNYYDHTNARYDFMSGTSMAAAFVSAAAARRMGYKPAETNENVGTLIFNSGDPMNTTLANCTVSEMQGLKRVNVATLLDRTAVRVSVFDAATGVPLNGATVGVSYLNDGVSNMKTSTIAPTRYTDVFAGDPDPSRIFTYYIPLTDIIDIPTVSNLGNPITNYSLLVSQPGFTSGYQPAFLQYNTSTLPAGQMNVFLEGSVPPATADLNVVLGWQKWKQFPKDVQAQGPKLLNDLDLYVWLPDDNLNTDPSQPASFVVGYDGDPFGQYVQGDSYGTMTDFPFARLKREGGYTDSGPLVESTSIASRAAHGTVPANAALPYYAGAYTIMATDYGQTIDHDGDGCGDNYGYNYSAAYTGTGPECGPGTTPGIPLLGGYYTPFAYVWRGGVMQYFQTSAKASFTPWAAELTKDDNNCNDHWWKAFTISSTTLSTVPSYTPFFAPGSSTIPLCGAGADLTPYANSSANIGRITLLSK